MLRNLRPAKLWESSEAHGTYQCACEQAALAMYHRVAERHDVYYAHPTTALWLGWAILAGAPLSTRPSLHRSENYWPSRCDVANVGMDFTHRTSADSRPTVLGQHWQALLPSKPLEEMAENFCADTTARRCLERVENALALPLVVAFGGTGSHEVSQSGSLQKAPCYRGGLERAQLCATCALAGLTATGGP